MANFLKSILRNEFRTSLNLVLMVNHGPLAWVSHLLNI